MGTTDERADDLSDCFDSFSACTRGSAISARHWGPNTSANFITRRTTYRTLTISVDARVGG